MKSLILIGLFIPFTLASYYTDQKQNCTNLVVKHSYCYNGPQFDSFGQYKSCSVPSVMAITFDDSPSKYTSSILDVLKKYSMKATFNVIGSKIPQNVALIQRMVDEGHQISSHTYHHVDLTTVTDVAQEMIDFEVALVRENFTGALSNHVIPNYMRAPHGIVTENVMTVLHQLGYNPVHWGFLTRDSDGINAPTVLDTYYSHLGGSSGINVDTTKLSVITQQHDTQYSTYVSFPEVVNYLNTTLGSKGVKFVTIAECLGNTVPAYRQNTRLQNDPFCANGLIGKDNTGAKKICCAKSCGVCGGTGCSTHMGGANGCCGSNIIANGYSCKLSPAPCLIF